MDSILVTMSAAVTAFPRIVALGVGVNRHEKAAQADTKPRHVAEWVPSDDVRRSETFGELPWLQRQLQDYCCAPACGT
jgi:hypothetical protein